MHNRVGEAQIGEDWHKNGTNRLEVAPSQSEAFPQVQKEELPTFAQTLKLPKHTFAETYVCVLPEGFRIC